MEDGFAEPPVEIQMQHYAFLIDDELFDRAYRWLCDHGVEHWADPQMRPSGERRVRFTELALER